MALTSLSMRLLPSRHRKCAKEEEACISLRETIERLSSDRLVTCSSFLVKLIFFKIFFPRLSILIESLLLLDGATIIDIDISIYIFKSIYARNKLFQYLVFEVRK